MVDTYRYVIEQECTMALNCLYEVARQLGTESPLYGKTTLSAWNMELVLQLNRLEHENEGEYRQAHNKALYEHLKRLVGHPARSGGQNPATGETLIGSDLERGR